MNIKEGKYTHKVTLVHYKGKVVTRYTNDPETRGEVLLDHGYKPMEGQDELVFTRINDDPITTETPVMPETDIGSTVDLDVFDEKDEEVVA
jgi:hypothetical protein|tara:strand:+ start:69 stop:341 length:273 start_codon:yes stop_codon:yes gene_type:complete